MKVFIALVVLLAAGIMPAMAEPVGSVGWFRKACVEMEVRNNPKTPKYLSRPPFTDQEISDYCGCVASTLADLLTEEEWFWLRQHPPTESVPESIRESTNEKAKCVVVESAKSI